jgi:DNA sulfur modification protein DndD
MKIIKLSMSNFMPFKGSHSVDFPTDPSLNVMVVFGDNMRGKTSLLNALRWVFYGRALGRHLHEIPLHDLLNKDAASEGDFTMEVGVTYEADGHFYDLRRKASRRDHVAIPSRPEDMVIEYSLQKDSFVVAGNQVETEINRYVPEQVSRFFLFDGELLQEYETLLIEGSEQGSRIKDAIEQVLGVPTLLQGRVEVGALLRQSQKQQTKDLQQLQGMTAQAERQGALQEREAVQERSIMALSDRLRGTKEQRESLDDELEKVEAVFRAKTRSEELERRQGAILARQEDISEEKLSHVKEAWLDLIQPKLKTRQRQLLDEQVRISGIITKKGKLDSKIEDITRLLDESACPTCGQEMAPERRARHEVALTDLKSEVLALRADGDALGKVSSELRDLGRLSGSGVGATLRSLAKEERVLSVELTKIDNEKEKIDEQIRGYDTESIASKRRLRDSLIKTEGGVEREITEADKDLKKTRDELAVVSRVIANLPEARARRSTAKVALCQALEKAFSESVERLRDDLRRKVETKATEAFARLTTQKKYMGLEINSNYGLTILDEKGERVGVRSAGAEQIVALSLIDGLARTGRAAGPVVMDTPFGRLDLNHRDNILRYLPETTSQLVLLVHDGELRKDTDLAPVASRIGKSYVIREVTPRHSKIEVQPL